MDEERRNPVDLSAAGSAGLLPQVASTADGTVAAAWRWNDGNDWLVQVSILPVGSTIWSPPIEISGGGVDSRGPRIVASPNGGFAIAWARWDGRGWRVQVSTLTAGARTWSAPTDLGDVGSSNPNMVASSDGTLSLIHI